jgi:Glycosyl transferases group 1
MTVAHRRVLFLYNEPGWAIHNVGLDWASLVTGTHAFTFARFGEHENEDPSRYDHVVWGYSTLRHSGRMRLRSLLQRPAGMLRWETAAMPNRIAVVQDPSELFPERPDWRDRPARTSHLARFARLAVTSHEMEAAMTRLGYRAVRVPTRSRLAPRDPGTLALEPLRVCTRAQRYPRKDLPRFHDLQARLAGVVDRFDALLGGTVRPQAEYAAGLDAYNCYVCTSWQEGGPLPVLDALRRGCVVLSTRVGQTDEWIEPGVNGFLCDSTDEFEARLRELAADPERLLAMRRASLARGAGAEDAFVRARLQEFLP